MSTVDDRIAAAGRLLAEAWRGATTVNAFSEDLFPRDVAEATAIQDDMARRIGDTVVGWKVGGVPGPLVGRVYGSCLFANPAILPVGRFHGPRIECEFGFRLRDDLPLGSKAYDRDQVLDAAILALTIEITGSRFIDGKHTAENDRELRVVVADNAAGAALVAGPEIGDWRHLSLLDVPVALRIDGGSPLPMNPRERRTDPVEILVWLVAELAGRGIGLEAGQLISTGSATLPGPLRPGSTAVAAYGDLGQVSVTLPGT